MWYMPESFSDIWQHIFWSNHWHFLNLRLYLSSQESSAQLPWTLALFNDSFQSFWFRPRPNVTIIIIITAFIIFPFLTVQIYSIFIYTASVSIKRMVLAPNRQQWQEKPTGRNLDQDRDHNGGVEINEYFCGFLWLFKAEQLFYLGEVPVSQKKSEFYSWPLSLPAFKSLTSLLWCNIIKQKGIKTVFSSWFWYLCCSLECEAAGNCEKWPKKIRKALWCIICGDVSFTWTIEGNHSDPLLTKLQNLCLCL